MNKLNNNTYRVLSIDGGGMLGYYSACYLEQLTNLAAKRFEHKNFNLHNTFDMLVGTSTGAIIACGLAVNMSPAEIAKFYEEHGMKIFPNKMPNNLWSLIKNINRSKINEKGDNALRKGLKVAFGNITLGDIYNKNKLALVIPSINATTHAGYVFKTPHNKDTNHRDDNISLADACLASSAAPLYRSLANIDKNLFIDGGLWANNPVLVALSEALRLTADTADKYTKIEIYCLGMSPTTGSMPDASKPHWGFLKWRFGSKAVQISIDSQKGVFDYLAKELSRHIDREISITRFPQGEVAEEHHKLLSLDNASVRSIELMHNLAKTAGDNTNKAICDSENNSGKLIASLLTLNHKK